MFAQLDYLMGAGEWFIIPEHYDSLLMTYARLTKFPAEQFGDSYFDLFSKTPLAKQGLDKAGIAHVVADGMFSPRLSMINKKCGGVDTAEMIGSIKEMVDSGARGFMFHVNSPGGTGGLIPELAQLISSLSVPTASYCYGVEASAATWAFAGVGLKGATPSAVMGSIGGFIPWIDKSKALEAAGLKWEPVVSEGADLKLAGSGPSLTDAERAYLKASLDDNVRLFQNHVINSRMNKSGKTVDMITLSKGGAYRADKAASMGLVDATGDYSAFYTTLLERTKR